MLKKLKKLKKSNADQMPGNDIFNHFSSFTRNLVFCMLVLIVRQKKKKKKKMEHGLMFQFLSQKGNSSILSKIFLHAVEAFPFGDWMKYE